MATPQPEAEPVHPTEVADRRFTISRKGYEPEEVHAFLHIVADHLSRLQGEVEWQRARNEQLERRAAAAQESAYARLARDFVEVVRRADQAAGGVRAQAEIHARSELALARQDAERMIASARREAEAIVARARMEAGVEPEREEWRLDVSDIWEAPSMETHQLFGELEQPPSPAQPAPLPETGTGKGHGHGLAVPADDLDDLDFEIDVSIFELFDDPDA